MCVPHAYDAACFAAWRPHHHGGAAMQQTKRLKARFAVGFAGIWPGGSDSIEQQPDVGKVQATLRQGFFPLDIVELDLHGQTVVTIYFFVNTF